MTPLTISPPLLNSSNPWCTTVEQLEELYNTPHTGAVTTRTSLLTNGFPHNSSTHQFTFYNPTTFSSSEPNKDEAGASDQTGSLNTLGYSPIPLDDYLGHIKAISDDLEDRDDHKPFIISVTGSAEEVVECYKKITAHQKAVRMTLAMEVNLSCPNIPGKPPPAYSSEALLCYLTALKAEMGRQSGLNGEHVHIPIGIKTPPYTYHDQFQALIDALLKSSTAVSDDRPCPVAFITATNTLGSSLLLSPSTSSESTAASTINSANGSGVGGLAGAPLHPLALGNVYTIHGLLQQHEELKGIQIIGVGGVEDVHGARRMRNVGAAAVGVGTALGRKGVKVFEQIGKDALEEKEAELYLKLSNDCKVIEDYRAMKAG
jgi:dihydroorotate dehydrogenase (fumarate)